MEYGTLIVQVLEAVGLLVGSATIIARLTPTKKDDSIVEKVRLFVEKVSNLFLPDRKEE